MRKCRSIKWLKINFYKNSYNIRYLAISQRQHLKSPCFQSQCWSSPRLAHFLLTFGVQQGMYDFYFFYLSKISISKKNLMCIRYKWYLASFKELCSGSGNFKICRTESIYITAKWVWNFSFWNKQTLLNTNPFQNIKMQISSIFANK